MNGHDEGDREMSEQDTLNLPSRREFLQAGIAVTGSMMIPGAASLAQTGAAPKGKLPNLLFIYGEGHRADALSAAGHAILKTPNHDRIGNEGVRFENAFCTNALCAPARSSVLTGMYSKSTGALGNNDLDRPLPTPYFTDMLREAGYEIALVGKAHCRVGAVDRKWDYYFGFNAPVTNYYEPKFVEGHGSEIGPEKTYEGYADDIALEKALAWLQKPREKPFCLLFWPQTPHAPHYRARRHLDLFNGVTIPKPSTFDDDLKGWPGRSKAVVEARNKIGTHVNPDATRSLEELVKDYYAGLVAVDEMIGKLFAHLEQTGELDNTAILHSSDHGYFLGEFRMFDKRLMYEPSIRVPMMIRYPKSIKAGIVRKEMVLDLDIAPTLLELAGIKPRKEMQGKSMVKLANAGDPSWRKEWLYDYYEYPGFEDVRPHRGIRTETHKLMNFYTVDEWEMYDIANDPEEKNNLFNIPAHAKKKEELKLALVRLFEATPQLPGGPTSVHPSTSF
jgi:arylsulfatase A-like enzyme